MTTSRKAKRGHRPPDRRDPNATERHSATSKSHPATHRAWSTVLLCGHRRRDPSGTAQRISVDARFPASLPFIGPTRSLARSQCMDRADRRAAGAAGSHVAATPHGVVPPPRPRPRGAHEPLKERIPMAQTMADRPGTGATAGMRTGADTRSSLRTIRRIVVLQVLRGSSPSGAESGSQ